MTSWIVVGGQVIPSFGSAMSKGDIYREVTMVMQQLRTNSIMVTVPKMQGWQTIPRSLIHGADERTLMRYQFSLPQEVTIRIFAWKADELHLS